MRDDVILAGILSNMDFCLDPTYYEAKQVAIAALMYLEAIKKEYNDRTVD